MDPKLINSLHDLHDSNSLSQADQLVCSILTNLGCHAFSYNFYPANFHEKKARHVLCTDQVADWQEHYSAHQYDQVDPILKRMRHSHLPFGWELKSEITQYEKNQRAVLAHAIDFGLKGGFAVPIHAPCGEFANLVIQDTDVLTMIHRHPELEHTLQLAAYHYHAKVTSLLANEQALIQSPLTTRETECLSLTLQHKTAKQIARILAITPRTVSFHIENALKKLHVDNKHQAASIAAQKGWLT